ncbi:hypothetical protein H6F95_17220 [Cyanobacteria bacterium FACHB-471]|nr:hypothetical protein [Cyanobacteria bacterium FACHB-471]
MAFIRGTEANDSLRGTLAQDTILGRGGNDILIGLDDDDVLSGGSGNDTLFGENNNDFLSGGPGNDWLQGTRGGSISGEKDRLVGGDGADQFVLSTQFNIFYRGSNSFATIRDFNRSEGDKVILKGRASDYKLQQVNGSDVTIRLASNNDLIGILENSQNFSLSTDIKFV